MYQGLINQIEKRQTLQSGYDFKSYKSFEFEVRSNLGCDLPTGYSNFLRITDGLFLNGVVIFASEANKTPDGMEIPGFVDENIKYRVSDKRFFDYLVFGVSKKDKFIFVYNLAKNEHQILDEKNYQPVERLEKIEDLINQALKRSLFAY